MDAIEVQSERAPRPIGPYSQGIAWGDLVLCSGQIALGPDGVLAKGGVSAEAEVAIRNLLAVLEAAGCSAKDVLKTTLYLIDMGDFAAVNEVYARLLGGHGGPAPARSTVAVAGLPKGARVEIDAIAGRRAGTGE